MPPRKPEVDPTSWAGDLCTFRFAGARPAAQLAAAANMGAAQLFSARDSANDFTCNVAGTDGLCNSVARGSSSIARFDPMTPTAALRDAPTDGWVLWWWSAFFPDHRLLAISPPSVPTETGSAGSVLGAGPQLPGQAEGQTPRFISGAMTRAAPAWRGRRRARRGERGARRRGRGGARTRGGRRAGRAADGGDVAVGGGDAALGALEALRERLRVRFGGGGASSACASRRCSTTSRAAGRARPAAPPAARPPDASLPAGGRGAGARGGPRSLAGPRWRTGSCGGATTRRRRRRSLRGDGGAARARRQASTL